jgi:ribosomal protein L17
MKLFIEQLLSYQKKAIFSFMVKPLNMEGKTEAKDQIEVAKKFVAKMIGEEIFEILMNNRKDALEIESNDSVVKLIDQLISFKRKNNLS